MRLVKLPLRSAYLLGQADALMLPVLDTSDLTVETVVGFLERQIESLRSPG